MPTVVVAVAAYALGLAGGYTVDGARLVALGVAVAVALGRWVRGDTGVLALLLVVYGAGAAAATADARTRAKCAHAVAQLGSWRVVLEDGAGSRGARRARLAEPACDAPVRLIGARGSGAAGDLVRVRGALIAVGRVAVIRDARLVPVRPERWTLRVRAAAGASIDRAFGGDAPLARALLVADTREIPDEVRDRFAAAGLVHVLSISGLHVAILAAAVELALGVAGVRRDRAAPLACVLATGYVAVLGFPPPALRAVAMLGVGAASRWYQRPTSPWAALALGAAAPLVVAPSSVLDLGYQLSVAGMAALIGGGAASRRWIAPRASGWRRAAGRELLTSILATLVTAPLVLWWFGQLSVAAPLTNLLAGPVVAALQPTLFLALLAAPVPALSRAIAGAAHPLLWLLDRIAAGGAALPWGVVHAAPSIGAAALLAAAAVAALVACASRAPARPAALAAVACTLAPWLPATWPWRRGEVELHMIDVGQGDAVALRTPRGRWILFDAGPAWGGGDAGRRTVVPYLRRRGGTLAAFVLSHPHLDHVGGAATVVQALRPREYWDAAYPAGGAAYRASLVAAGAGDVRWRRARPGDSLAVDGVSVRFLAPDSSWAATLPDANDASTVALVRYGAVRVLLVGDAESGEEAWLLRHAASDLRADVLKVGHHGSRTSTTQPFLDAVRPRVALISAGLGNEYGHPSGEVVGRLRDAGAQVLRTDVGGDLVVRTDGRRLTVTADQRTWLVSPAYSPP